MDNNAKKAKVSYLGKMKRIVASHVYDLGKKVLDEGIDNAKELHDVDLPVQKSMKDIVKEVITVNTKVKNYIKATKDEVSQTIKDGSKQAIIALKNDKEHMTTEEDKFLDSFDEFDLDDLDSEDWEEIMDGETSDSDEIATEAFGAQDMWDGAKRYAEMSQPTVVSKMTNDDISAAILLLIQKAPCPHFQELYASHTSEIENIVKTGTSGSVDEIEEGTGDKLGYVKAMIQDVNSDMVPNVGTEDMEDEVEGSGIVVEVVTTELPTTPEVTEDLEIKARVHRVIHMYLNKLESCISQDSELSGILSVAESKINGVATYASTICGKSDISIADMITSTITKVVPECLPVGKRLALAFYLGIIPADLIEQGQRIISIYYNKIIK